MKVITNRPIKEETSNCCGMSNFDDENFDMSTNLSDYNDSLGDDMAYDEFSFASGKIKEYLGAQKKEGKAFREDYLVDVLADRTTAKTKGRTRSNERREARQLARSERKEARFQRNKDRKFKRNAKKLVLIKTQGRENYLFPISRVRLGKKKYKDGTEGTVAEKDQLKVNAPNGEVATVDKKEVAKAMGVNPNTVTQADVQRMITVIPRSVVQQQGVNAEVNQTANEPVFAVNVPENNVETAFNGELYVTSDLQNTNETEKDVKEEEKGLTKTQKIVLWSAVGVATLLIGYVIYKSVAKSK
jgi:hypothetical protein